MHLKNKALVLSLLLITTPAFADLKQIGGAAAKSRGNMLTMAVQIAVAAAGYVIDEGRKPVRRTNDETAEGTEGAEAGQGVQTGSTSNSGFGFEYVIADQSFATAEAAHQYAITTLLDKRGYKRTRRLDGLYYDSLNVYMGYSGYNSTIGYFSSDVQVASKNQQCDNDVCGSVIQFIGSIYYKGTLSEKEVHLSDSYKANRAAAAAEFTKEFETMTDAELEAVINGVKAQPNAQQAQAEAGANADAKAPSTTTNTKAEAKAEAKDDAKADEKADEATKDKAKPREEQKPFEMPDFCKWAKFICAEPELEVTEKPDVLEPTMPQNTVKVSFSKSCPADKVIPFSWGSVNTQFVMSYSYICDLATKLAALVQICSTLFALYILAGIKS